jgi:hypothetical protein
MIRFVTFTSSDMISLTPQPTVQIAVGVPYVYPRLVRLTDTRAALVVRNPSDSDKVSAVIIDAPSDFSIPVFGPFSVVSAGTSPTYSLPIGIAATAADRIVFTYFDSNGAPCVMDAGVYSNSIVNGRCVHSVGYVSRFQAWFPTQAHT